MIEVNIKYYTTKRGKTKKLNVYPLIEVVGHANNGTIQSIKCCAGITAVLLGFSNCVYKEVDNVKITKGYFKYVIYSNIAYNLETMCMAHCVVSQLYVIYKTYPQFFKSFNIEKVEV